MPDEDSVVRLPDGEPPEIGNERPPLGNGNGDKEILRARRTPRMSWEQAEPLLIGDTELDMWAGRERHALYPLVRFYLYNEKVLRRMVDWFATWETRQQSIREERKQAEKKAQRRLRMFMAVIGVAALFGPFVSAIVASKLSPTPPPQIIYVRQTPLPTPIPIPIPTSTRGVP